MGFIVDPVSCFDTHILFVVKKLSKSIPKIRKIRPYLTEKCLKIICHPLMYPYLIYCNSAWGGVNKVSLKPINIIQRGIIRSIRGVNRKKSAEPLCRSSNF